MPRHHLALALLVPLLLAAATPEAAGAQFGKLKEAARRRVEEKLLADSAKKKSATAPATVTNGAVSSPSSGGPLTATDSASARDLPDLGTITAAHVDAFVTVRTALDTEYERLRPSIEYANVTASMLRVEAVTECRLGGAGGYAASKGVAPDSLRRLLALRRHDEAASMALDSLELRFIADRGTPAAEQLMAACMAKAPTLVSLAPRLRQAAVTLGDIGLRLTVESKPIRGAEPDEPEQARKVGGSNDFVLPVDAGAMLDSLRHHLEEIQYRALGPTWNMRRFGTLQEFLYIALDPRRRAQALTRFDASGRAAFERQLATLERLRERSQVN